MKSISRIVRTGLVFGLIALPSIAMAAGSPLEDAGTMVTNVSKDAGFASQPTLPTLAGKIINAALTLLGIVLLAYLLFGGYKYMTAGGDSKKVDEGLNIIRNAIIGLVIIIASFALSTYILSSLVTATK